MNFTVIRFDTIGSTNDEALRQARNGAAEGLCIVAGQQTAGRGRHGRVWVSTPDSGLYFSVVLRPKFEARYLPLITLMAGIAVHDALQGFGLKPDIKWLNDVMVGDKKICGILAEATETSSGLAVIVGIGINVTSANFPDEIAETATSVKAESELSVTISELERSLARFLAYFYDILAGKGGPAAIVEEWRRRSTYFSGKHVRVQVGDETVTGFTDGLEPTGALRIRRADGGVAVIQAGDVEWLRTAEQPPG